MHRFLCSCSCKFPNYFAFIRRCYLFLLYLVQFQNERSVHLQLLFFIRKDRASRFHRLLVNWELALPKRGTVRKKRTLVTTTSISASAVQYSAESTTPIKTSKTNLHRTLEDANRPRKTHIATQATIYGT